MKKVLLLMFSVWAGVTFGQYCTTGLYSTGCTFGDDLDYITLGNYSQSPTGCNTNSFGDFTGDTIVLQQAVVYSFTVATTYSDSEYMGAWIDFNNDQDFDDPGEFVATSGSTSFGVANPYTTNLSVGSTPLGNYRMRVRIRWNSAVAATNSCTSFSYGETHDYTVNVQPAPACPPPYALTASNVTDVSASLDWTSSGASSWSVIYGPAGFNPANSGTVVSVSSKPYAVSGLSPITTYDFYVIGDCGTNGLSDTSAVKSFTTLCAPFTAPYYKDFDTDSLDFPPTCWKVEKSVSGAFVEVEDFRPAVSGNRHLQFYSSSGVTTDVLRIVSPQFSDLTAGDKQISFWVNSSNINNKLYIGTTNDQVNGILSPIDTIDFSAVNSYEEYIIPITVANGYNGTDMFIYLAHSNGSSFTYIDLDNFDYDVIPPCPKITGISLNNSSSTTATFSFNSSGSSFDYEWGPTGFQQGTGTAGTANSNPFTITGLAPQNTYDIYIRNNCMAGGNGVSVYTGPFTFFTNCNALITPYYESFNTWPLSCWDTTGGTEYWAKYNGPSGNNYAVADFWNTSSGTYLLKSPAVGLSGQSQVRFSWSHLSSTSYPNDQLILRVRSHNNNVWDTLVNLRAADGNFNSPGAGNTTPGSFVEEIALIPATYNNDTIIVEIRGNSGFGPNAYVNNFYIEDAPLCAPTSLGDIMVDGVTSSSASFSWTPGDGAKWMVEIGVPGFVPGTQNGVDSAMSADTVETFAGLAPNTTYELYLRDSCTSGLFSPWVGPLTFTTACLPLSMPAYESLDFWPVACWDSTQGSINWEKYSTGTGDNYAMADFWGNSTGNFILTSPPVSITQDAQIRFYWSHLYSTSYPDEELLVRVKVAGTAIWDTVLSLKGPNDFNDASAGNTTPGNFIEEEIILDPVKYTNQDVVIEFVGITDFGPNLYLNDIYVENAPSCPKIISTNVISTTPSSAVIGWQASTNATSYDFWYGPQGFYQGSQTTAGTVLNTSNTQLTLSTLGADSCYEYLLRAKCGPNDSSVWIGPFIFCTPCAVQSAPYYEDFENHAIGHYNGANQCWDFVSNNPGSTPSGGFSWEVRNTPQTTSSNTGPAGDNTLYPGLGGKWIHSDNSGGATNDTTLLISPFIDITSLTAPELEYHFHNFAVATSNYRQALYVDIHDGVNWINKVHEIDSVYQTSATAPWHDTIIDLTPYSANGQVRVRFRTKITRQAGGSGDVAIDDIRISDPLSCFEPTNLMVSNLTSSSANLNWSNGPGSTGSSFMISYGASLNDPALGTQMMVSGNSYAMTGLTSSSNYCFFVREVCAPGDSSTWAGPYCFNTPCPNFNTPYYEDFDVWPLSCWSENGGSENFTSSPAMTGYHALAEFWNWPADSAVLTSPMVNIVSDSRVRFSWSHRYSASYPDDRLEVRVSKNGGPWTTILNLVGPAFDDPSAGNTTPGTFIEDTLFLDPAIYNNSTVQVQLRAYSDWGPNLYIDEFYIEENIPGCPVPDSLGVANLTCSTVDLEWSSSAGKPSMVEYGPAGFAPGSGTIVWGSSPLAVSGLSLGANYEFWVADTCGMDTSAFAGPYAFNTPTGPLSAGFSSTMNLPTMTSQVVDFDASGSAGATSYTWDFGDGSAPGTGMMVSHSYTANGVYDVTLLIDGPCGMDSITQQVTTFSINLVESALAQSLEIYPNPAQNQVKLSFEGGADRRAMISLTDLSGKQIISLELKSPDAQFEQMLDISALAKGTYMLKIGSGDMQVVRRIIKN